MFMQTFWKNTGNWRSIDSINWKQMFVQWANDFETVNEGIDWNHEDYLEKIEKFARHKILEYAGLEG